MIMINLINDTFKRVTIIENIKSNEIIQNNIGVVYAVNYRFYASKLDSQESSRLMQVSS